MYPKYEIEELNLDRAKCFVFTIIFRQFFFWSSLKNQTFSVGLLTVDWDIQTSPSYRLHFPLLLQNPIMIFLPYNFSPGFLEGYNLFCIWFSKSNAFLRVLLWTILLFCLVIFRATSTHTLTEYLSPLVRLIWIPRGYFSKATYQSVSPGVSSPLTLASHNLFTNIACFLTWVSSHLLTKVLIPPKWFSVFLVVCFGPVECLFASSFYIHSFYKSHMLKLSAMLIGESIDHY